MKHPNLIVRVFLEDILHSLTFVFAKVDYLDAFLVIDKATGKVNTTIPSNRKLVIDTETIPYSIREYDMNNRLIADLYEQSDFSTERFFMLKYGKNSIVVTDDDASTTTVIVEAQVMYASV